MRAFLGAGWLCLLWRAAAQTAVFTYDPAGNPVAVNTGASVKPSIIVSPQADLLESSSVAIFSVSAVGAGLSYQWLSNGVAIAGATSDSLILANLALVGTNLGYFSVIVSNSSGAITSAPAALWPDSNANGIPDWWEMQYFGNLNQKASGDFDGDGVSNLDEYLEGTNPADATSFNPRLRIQTAHGTVSVSPNLPHYSLGQFVTLTATPDPGHLFLNWNGDISGTKSRITFVMDTNKTVTARFGLPLPVALDNSSLIWTTGGDASWFGQVEVSEDGVGSAQSGPIVSVWNGSSFVGEQTWLQTVTNMSQTMRLGFWWNVSSRPPAGLAFSVDGTNYASLSGEAVGWQYVQTNLNAGLHTLLWTYSKGPVDIPTGLPFADSGWVDQVTLAPTNAAPLSVLLSILRSPTNTVLVSWPATSPAFSLQQNSVLGTTNWVGVTNSVSVANGTNQVLITPAASAKFYRLKFP